MTPASSAPLEAKVVVPTITTAMFYAVIAALYFLAKSFGLSFDTEQERAFAAVGVALAPFIQFVVGYYAPHTARPDVAHPARPQKTALQKVAADDVGGVPVLELVLLALASFCLLIFLGLFL